MVQIPPWPLGTVIWEILSNESIDLVWNPILGYMLFMTSSASKSQSQCSCKHIISYFLRSSVTTAALYFRPSVLRDAMLSTFLMLLPFFGCYSSNLSCTPTIPMSSIFVIGMLFSSWCNLCVALTGLILFGLPCFLMFSLPLEVRGSLVLQSLVVSELVALGWV